MNPLDYLKAIRRRWFDIVLAVGVAVGIGSLVSTVSPAKPVQKTYEATSILIADGPSFSTNVKTMAVLARAGDVPARVARDLKFKGDPLTLADQIRASGDTTTGVLRITATSTNSAETAALANAFARELVGSLQERRAAAISRETVSLEARLFKLQSQATSLDQRIAGAPASSAQLLTAQRDAAVRQYGLAYERYQQLANDATTTGSGLVIVQNAAARPVADEGFQAPRTKTSRMIFAGILGLLAGVGIVFALERFDERIRNRQGIEKHFDAPVIAEIPRVHGPRSGRQAVTVARRPRSPSADAFRQLAAELSRTSQATSNGDLRAPGTILITSPGPGDGKSTVVANLAVAMAEVGKKVIVLSCDFRRPQVHRLLGVRNDQGLAEALRSANGNGHAWRVLDGTICSTNYEDVRVVPSGPPIDRPVGLFSSPAMKAAIAEARRESDVVLLDSPPLLTSEVTYLLDDVEGVVLVVRAGRTTPELADRSSALLRRLHAPLAGVVLNGADVKLPQRYYLYLRNGRGRGIPYLSRLLRRA